MTEAADRRPHPRRRRPRCGRRHVAQRRQGLDGSGVCRERSPRRCRASAVARRIAVHADLGSAEWRETPATVEAIAASLGLPLFVVRQTRHDLVGRWHDRFDRGLARYAALETLCLIGPWSSAKLRFCTSEAKAAVITRFLKSQFAGQEVISVIGIRRAESPARRHRAGLGRRSATDVPCRHPWPDLAPARRLVGGRRLRAPRARAAAAAHRLHPLRQHASVVRCLRACKQA